MDTHWPLARSLWPETRPLFYRMEQEVLRHLQVRCLKMFKKCLKQTEPKHSINIDINNNQNSPYAHCSYWPLFYSSELIVDFLSQTDFYRILSTTFRALFTLSACFTRTLLGLLVVLHE